MRHKYVACTGYYSIIDDSAISNAIGLLIEKDSLEEKEFCILFLLNILYSCNWKINK